MNLDPSIWGPHYWATLHFMASTYDNHPNKSIQSTMKNFIYSLPVFLPCKECQDHAFDFIKTSNLNKVIESRKDLFTFFFNFHNTVNQRLKKPLLKIEDALKKYHVPVEEHHLYLPSKGRVGPVFGITQTNDKDEASFKLIWLYFVPVIIIIAIVIFK